MRAFLRRVASRLAFRRRTARALRRAGDAAQRAGDWSEAAALYGRYLRSRPRDHAIQVQLAHALKEAGDLDGADRAYAAATILSPGDAEPLLHHARLKKRLGEYLQARTLLARSLALDFSVAAFDELRELAVANLADRDEGAMLADLSAHVTGIAATMMLDATFDPVSSTLSIEGEQSRITLAIAPPAAAGDHAGLLRFDVAGPMEGEAQAPGVTVDFGAGLPVGEACRPVVAKDGYAVLLVRPGLLRAIQWHPDDHAGRLTLRGVRYDPINDAAALEAAMRAVDPHGEPWSHEAAWKTRVLAEEPISVAHASALQQLSPSRMTPGFDYDLWTRLYDDPTQADHAAMRRRVAALAYKPIISVLVPVYDTPPDLLAACLESVLRSDYPRWELCIADDGSTDHRCHEIIRSVAARDGRVKVAWRPHNGHIAAATNSALALATGDFVALLDHDDLIAGHALSTMACFINDRPHADVLFSDEDKIDLAGRRHHPFFKTDFDRYLMYGQNMVNHLAVFRRALITDLGGFREGYEGSQDYDLVLRCLDRVGRERFTHVPHVLYHWRRVPGSTAITAAEKDYAGAAARRAIDDHFGRTGRALRSVPGSVPGTHAVAATVAVTGDVTIIIPTRDGAALLEPCVEAIRAHSTGNVEILIVDNGSTNESTLDLLARLAASGIRVVRDDEPFNFSRINNAAVRHASNDLLCFLNDDTRVRSPGWLDRARLLLGEPDVGIVGARLVYPDGHLQHFGCVLGVGKEAVAGHAGIGLPHGDAGPFNRSGLMKECSAVTGACLFTSRKVFDQVGGFDPALAVAFNDIDLCLKVRHLGLRIVVDPQIDVVHLESRTRGSDQQGSSRARMRAEAALMRARWRGELGSDPYYSPNLSNRRLDFAYAYPPRTARPWAVGHDGVDG